MHIQARRIFSLTITPALALVIAYGIPIPLPFIAPLFALFLTAMPGPPLSIKKTLGLIILVMITMGIGLMLIPLLFDGTRNTESDFEGLASSSVLQIVII